MDTFFFYAKVKSLTRQYHKLGAVLLVERGIHTLVYLNTFYINYLILLVPSFNRLTHVSLNERWKKPVYHSQYFSDFLTCENTVKHTGTLHVLYKFKFFTLSVTIFYCRFVAYSFYKSFRSGYFLWTCTLFLMTNWYFK